MPHLLQRERPPGFRPNLYPYSRALLWLWHGCHRSVLRGRALAVMLCHSFSPHWKHVMLVTRLFEAKAGDLVFLLAKVLCACAKVPPTHSSILFSLEHWLFFFYPESICVTRTKLRKRFCAHQQMVWKREEKRWRKWKNKNGEEDFLGVVSVQSCIWRWSNVKAVCCIKIPRRHRSVASCWLASVRMNAISPYAHHFPWCCCNLM